MYACSMRHANFWRVLNIKEGGYVQLKGKIIKWNGDKAFGFIAPFAGGSEIFIHLSGFRNRTRVPRLNDIVTFTVSKDKDGRYRAEDARYAGEKLKKKQKSNVSTFSIVLAIGFLIVMTALSYMDYLPKQLKYAYYGLSVITFMIYAYDKYKAKRNAWRTPESTLHILAMLGGWPGAALAQQVLRHKSSKADFRRIFWLTVVINLAMLGWLLSTYGADLRALISNAMGSLQ